MTKTKNWSGFAAVLCAGLVSAGSAGCGQQAGYDGAAGADAGISGIPECFSSNECPTGWTCSEFGTCVQPPPSSGDAGVPDPDEVEYELAEPVSSLRYIYVAMSELDALAKIDGQTLGVTSVAVGERPKVVVAAPNTDTAVVLDSINGTATIVRPTVDRDQKITLATLPNLNQILIDPLGKYAVAWFDLNKAIADAGGLGAVDRVGSFQDVTIISLEPGEEAAVDLTVGFRPREVEFDDAGVRAFVITEDGVSVIDLAAATQQGPSIVPPLPVASDPFVDADSIEVDVVSTGEYAVVRESGMSEVRVLRLTGSTAGQSWTIPLSSVPSDLDLSPDGARAYAVLRDSSSLAVIDIPGDAFDPTGVDEVDLGGQVVGSLVVSRDGTKGMLFTNAFSVERITTIALDDPGFAHTTYPLQKSIRLAHFSPSGDKAIIVHAKQAGDPASAESFDDFVDMSYGYSVFDFAQGFAKLQITPVDPGSFAFPESSDSAYLIIDGGDAEGAVAELHTIELDTGVVRTTRLGSPPSSVGVLPNAGVAFVSQRHPLGRVTFIDTTTGDQRTLTGFDLNSRIID